MNYSCFLTSRKYLVDIKSFDIILILKQKKKLIGFSLFLEMQICIFYRCNQSLDFQALNDIIMYTQYIVKTAKWIDKQLAAKID